MGKKNRISVSDMKKEISWMAKIYQTTDWGTRGIVHANVTSQQVIINIRTIIKKQDTR